MTSATSNTDTVIAKIFQNHDENLNVNSHLHQVHDRRNSLSDSSTCTSLGSFDSSKTFVMDGILGKNEYKVYKALKASQMVIDENNINLNNFKSSMVMSSIKENNASPRN